MRTKVEYAEMQKHQYQVTAINMHVAGNHRSHDANPDYRGILLAPLDIYKDRFKDECALDFGCGHGRNVSNMILWFPNLFKRVDGVDISSNNLLYANANLLKEVGDESKFKLFVNNGMDLAEIESDFYMFAMSTIVFQHICVHETRFALMSEIYRVLKSGGIFSLQMGFGQGHHRAAEYYDNIYDADSTNSGYDTKVTDVEQLAGDLDKIGFKNIQYNISHRWEDSHQNWIYIHCEK